MPSREEKARAELVGGIRSLAKARGTTPEGLFRMYDGNGNGQLDRVELRALLADAHVGNALTRPTWVSQIFARLDKDNDDELSLQELDGVLAADSASPTPKKREKLTSEEAARIARRIAAGEDVDLSGYTQDEIAMIEAWNLDLTQPAPQREQRGASFGGVGAVVLLVVVALAVSRG